MDNSEVQRPRPCVGCDLLPVRSQRMLDVHILDSKESGKARPRYSPNGRSLPRTLIGDTDHDSVPVFHRRAGSSAVT